MDHCPGDHMLIIDVGALQQRTPVKQPHNTARLPSTSLGVRPGTLLLAQVVTSGVASALGLRLDHIIVACTSDLCLAATP